MIRKLTLAVGFGAGYVLGAKAGKERYRQIEGKVRELMGRSDVTWMPRFTIALSTVTVAELGITTVVTTPGVTEKFLLKARPGISTRPTRRN